MHGIHKPVPILLRKQPRRHTRPERKHHKRHQVAHRERATSCLEQGRRCVVVQPGDEHNRPGNVDEAVYAVDDPQGGRPLKEPALHIQLDEQSELLLEVDNGEPVRARDVNGVLLQRHRGERASKLIRLHTPQSALRQHERGDGGKRTQ